MHVVIRLEELSMLSYFFSKVGIKFFICHLFWVSEAIIFDVFVTSLFVQSQFEHALLEWDIVWVLYRVVTGQHRTSNSRPCFTITFCPSWINEVREVVFPTQAEFLSCFVIVLYFDVAYVSECWVVHEWKLIFIFIVCKNSHEEVLGLIHSILASCTFNGSYYFAIDAECHFIRDPLNFVVIEVIMILNSVLLVPRAPIDGAASIKETRSFSFTIMNTVPFIPHLTFRWILFSQKVERRPSSVLFWWSHSGFEAAVLESLFRHDLCTRIWFGGVSSSVSSVFLLIVIVTGTSSVQMALSYACLSLNYFQ